MRQSAATPSASLQTFYHQPPVTETTLLRVAAGNQKNPSRRTVKVGAATSGS
ncbi:unnamed protein product [Ceratitis capitata]|uniref:(Mediterranean fruit fly) hypothetical protein n=1 Tax=Ceratitis capitata TaxID=7213 RepID=A0A811VFR3_CERCA|nr:unnamed protein product [Ceratitis capitata]